MLSGFHRREEPGSPAFNHPHTTVKPFGTAKATVGLCSISIHLGVSQKMVESLSVPPLKTQGLALSQPCTHSMNKSAGLSNEPQILLLQGYRSKSPTGDLKTNGSTDIQQKHSKLSQLACSNDSSHFQPSKTTLQLQANTTILSASTSMHPSGSKTILRDDEILNLIEKKLEIYRTQMKILQARRSIDVDLNSKTTSPASTVSENNVVSADREGAFSNNRRPDPSNSQMKRAPTAEHSTEYDRVMQKTEAFCEKMDNPVAIEAMSGPTLEKPVEQKPSNTVRHKPTNQECSSMWRNGNFNPHISREHGPPITHKNIIKGAGIIPGVADSSILSKSSLNSLETFNQHPGITEIHTSHSTEMFEENTSISSVVRNHLHLSPNVCIVKSPAANNKQVTEPEPVQNEPIEEVQEKRVQAGEGIKEMDLWPCKSGGSSILKDSKYDDITDDEEFSVMQQKQPSANGEKDSHMRVFMQSPEQITDANPPSTTPKQQEPEMPLTCTCPYFVENNDGFEKRPCPKCAKDTLRLKLEVESEDDSEVILFAAELIVEEVIVVNSDDDDVEQNVSSPELLTHVQKLEEYDTLHCYLIQKNLPNPVMATKTSPALSFEKIAPEPMLSPSSSPKHLETTEKAPKIASLPKAKCLAQIKNGSGPSTHADAEDCSETKDSFDYPSHTKSNYLTEPKRLRVRSPQSCDAEGDEDEVHTFTPEETSNTNWFPDLSPEETEEEEPFANTVLPKNEPRKAKSKSRPVAYNDSDSENDKEIHRRCKNVLPVLHKRKKSGLIASDLDSDEFDQDCSKRSRKTSSESNTCTLQPKPNLIQSRQHEKVLKSRSLSGDSTSSRNCGKIMRTSSVDSVSATKLPKTYSKPSSTHQALGPEQHCQNGHSVSRKVLNSVKTEHHSRKQKHQATEHEKDKKVKRKNLSSELKTLEPEINTLLGHDVKAHVSKPIVSQLRKQNGQFGSKPPSLSSQSHRKVSEVQEPHVTGNMSLGGENYYESTLPLNQPMQNHIQTTASNLRHQIQPTLNSTPNESQPTPGTVRTSAKERKAREWAESHVPIRVEKKSSNNEGPCVKPASRREQDVSKPKRPKPRKKHHPYELQTALMKKTKHEAQQWTRHNRKEPQHRINRPVGEGYKWKNSKPVEDSLPTQEFLEKYGGISSWSSH